MKRPAIRTRKKQGARPATERLAMKFRPESFNVEGQEITCYATIATQTPVKRFGYSEILSCAPQAINPERLIGMPVLDSHQSGIDNVLGRVDSYHFEGTRVVAKLRFAKTKRGRDAAAQVEDGTINKVSVAYYVDADTESRAPDGTYTVTVTRWTPFEVSLVSVPADPNANIRGVNMKRPRRVSNPPPLDISQDDMVDDATITDDDDDSRQTRSASQTISRQAERSIESVRSGAINAGVAEADIDEALEDVTTPDEARRRAFALMSQRSNRNRTSPTWQGGDGSDNSAIREAAADALAYRIGSPKLQVQNNQMAGRSVAGIFRAVMEASGVSTRNMDDVRVIDEALHGTRAGMTTSDFPALFVDASQRVLTEIFEAAQSPLKALSRKRNARDFRPVSMIRPGGFPQHKKVLERGEIVYGTFDIENEAFSILSYAVAISLSRQMMVNDDLGIISDIINQAGNSAVNDEGDLFFKLLSENSFGGRKLADGKNFFHADHDNLAASGTALDVTNVSAARQAMRLQKGVDGKTTAGAAPAVLVVGPALETIAEQLVATLTAATVDTVNPFSGKLSVQVENRYEAKGWWLFADARSRPTFVHGYLEGFQEGPRIRSEEPFGRQGMSFSSEFDFGCGVYDYRAAYFNPGVA
ncbi:prohead protease/major capsid protein fusion protein [Mesorhizobium sp. B1-1-7]|uniref:prohead protease/major capsid protein fusion protein n=1 Tax=Mesorhizobium sp. B1-1-7 TaxID=2589977 RepID=UPI00112CDB27|nr:prohead protease/major capsid protein fusion protein [Mesorhizobium sp. B1-1-7]TPN49354.1 hypothetical protein FJ978_19345 [Mesorhizobium sp. B1-1-7]